MTVIGRSALDPVATDCYATSTFSNHEVQTVAKMQDAQALKHQVIQPDELTMAAPSTLFDLTGKVAIVTGASGGVGRWLAAGLAAAGGSLVLTDVDSDALEGIATQLRTQGAQVTTIAADLSDANAPQSIGDTARSAFGNVDILVNNAGANRRMPMLEVEPDDFDRVWMINFKQPYFLAQATARAMKDAGQGGSIINISSVNFSVGIDDLSIYGPTKAALSQLTRVMAIEWAPLGIRSNAIAPGFLDTPMNASHWSHPTRAPWILDRIPMARPGLPEELVGTCLLLASKAGSYITGQTLVVDGGFLSGSSWNTAAGTSLRAFLGGDGR
jgi:NAD(P)-dependent dehydrogenase (short-subunit alcohol dehydrogenase family)